MNTLNSVCFDLQAEVNREVANVYRFINKHRYVILAVIILAGVIGMINPVFADDLFDIAKNSAANIATKLTNVYAFGIFPAVAVVCGVGIGLSKDPKKVETFKTWLIRAVIALILIVGYKLVIRTINNITNNSEIQISE